MTSIPPSPLGSAQEPPKPVSQDESTFAMLLHLSPLLGYMIPIPAANIVCPLVMWLIKKDGSPFIDEQGKESLNFQITITLALLVSAALIMILIGIVLIPVVLVFQIVYCVLAAMAAK
jgi:uncharacterized Tic20 family protein